MDVLGYWPKPSSYKDGIVAHECTNFYFMVFVTAKARILHLF
jgi:hypothetical protein